MTTETKANSTVKTYPLPMGQAMISGRVEARRKVKVPDGSAFFTVIKTPARDAYSHPGTIELRSKTAIGNVGEDWSGLVRIDGYPRNYDSKPDGDGVVTKIKSSQNILDVIED